MNRVLIMMIMAMSLYSCQQQEEKRHKVRRHANREELIDYNRRLVARDSAYIVHYCYEHNLDSVPTRNGIWYTETKVGEGSCIQNGQEVDIAYTISDIAGEVYYTSVRDGIKHIVTGSGQDIMAMDIVLPYLRKGSVATFIAMPDLAYGLTGDENRIGARRILRYDIEVLSVK